MKKKKNPRIVEKAQKQKPSHSLTHIHTSRVYVCTLCIWYMEERKTNAREKWSWMINENATKYNEFCASEREKHKKNLIPTATTSTTCAFHYRRWNARTSDLEILREAYTHTHTHAVVLCRTHISNVYIHFDFVVWIFHSSSRVAPFSGPFFVRVLRWLCVVCSDTLMRDSIRNSVALSARLCLFFSSSWVFRNGKLCISLCFGKWIVKTILFWAARWSNPVASVALI